MSKFNFGKFPEVEGWFWVRPIGGGESQPYFAMKQGGKWWFDNGSYRSELKELEGCEFCKMEVPE